MSQLLSLILGAVKLPPGSFTSHTVVEESSSWLNYAIGAAGLAATAYFGTPVAVVALNAVRDLLARPTQKPESVPSAGVPQAATLTLPKLEHDFSACFVRANELNGQNRAEVFRNTQTAIENPQSWRSVLSLEDREAIKRSITDWVNMSFAQYHMGSAVDQSNSNHKVFVAYLYWRSVARLAAGEFGRGFDCVEAAEAIKRAASFLLVSGATDAE